MKPGEEQIVWLQSYLGSVLTYRETYEEVYDHILLALDKREEVGFFESIVNSIVEQDFGGTNGLWQIEQNCKTATAKAVKRQYWQYAAAFIKLPHLIGTCIAVLALFYIASHTVGFITLVMLFAFIVFIPFFLLSIRGFRIGYRFSTTKESLKDYIFRRIIFRPFLVYLFVLGPFSSVTQGVYKLIFHHELGFKFLTPTFLSITLIALVIHTIAYMKLYRDEFKIKLADS